MSAGSPWGDRFGINTYSYTQTMSAIDCVRLLIERGVRDIELMLYPGHLWITDSRQTLREKERIFGCLGLGGLKRGAYK